MISLPDIMMLSIVVSMGICAGMCMIIDIYQWIQKRKWNKMMEEEIKVYSIDFKDTWSKIIKAHSKKEAIKIFKEYSGEHPRYFDIRYKVKLLTHDSWYKDKDWLKTTGIFSGDGVKKRGK